MSCNKQSRALYMTVGYIINIPDPSLECVASAFK